MTTTHALVATVRFHGAVIEQRTVLRGRALTLDGTGPVAIPMPRGAPYLARCEWSGVRRVTVLDGRGRQYLLEPEGQVDLTFGPVDVNLSLAPQFSLRRSVPISIVASVAWAAIVLMATNTYTTAEMLYTHRCDWFGLYCPVPASGSGTDVVTAEYLARLLREDFAGDDQGAITQKIEREDSEEGAETFYMPAGHEGPKDTMGGAEDTAPDPIRTPEEQEQLVPDAGGEPELLVVEDSEVEIESQAVDRGEDGIVDAEVEDPEDAVEAPAEDKEGWGVRDWYDVQDERLENLEIELTILEARRQLAIDPNSSEALQVLAYYQYLAEDHDAAMDTYDKYIKLYPDESAGYNNKALVYKRLEEYEIEEKMYRVALAIDPGDVTAMNNLAVCLAHLGRYDEALALMKSLETLDPGNAYADLHRSKIYAEMGDEDQALVLLDRALTGMKSLNTLHHIEFRQDIRVDPSFAKLRETRAFRDTLVKYYGKDTPLQD